MPPCGPEPLVSPFTTCILLSRRWGVETEFWLSKVVDQVGRFFGAGKARKGGAAPLASAEPTPHSGRRCLIFCRAALRITRAARRVIAKLTTRRGDEKPLFRAERWLVSTIAWLSFSSVGAGLTCPLAVKMPFCFTLARRLHTYDGPSRVRVLLHVPSGAVK